MSLNSPGHLASPNSGRGTPIAESQGSLSQQRVEVTVHYAQNVPRIKKQFGQKRRFVVTATNHATTMNTKSALLDGRQMVHWNQSLGAFSSQPPSRLMLRLYEKRYLHSDALIGTCEVPMPVEPQTVVPFVLSNRDGQVAHSSHPLTLYLTVIVSSNSYPNWSIDATNVQFPEVNESPLSEATSSMSRDSTNTIQSTVATGSETPPTENLPSTLTLLERAVPQDQGEMSLVETTSTALDRANEFKRSIDQSVTWEGVVGRIKWVMDTLSPVSGLHPFAQMTYSVLLLIPQGLSNQYQRDDNVRTLVKNMHDAFDFTRHEDTLKSIKPKSKQAEILTLMLRDVCTCSDFIQSYTKDSLFLIRMLKNIGSGVEGKIQELSAALDEHRRAFLDRHAMITTEITTFQILNDVGSISDNLDGRLTKLEWVSSQVSDAMLDARIGEIPYRGGSRFTPDKGCLPGTRTAFLDFIVDWVNNPASKRCLILIGLAGTGKSSIAHEIAHRFNEMHRLTSSFIFVRKEQFKAEAYHLFTNLARDLADRYPLFKAALGRVIKDDSSLRLGTRDYDTIFRRLIREPLNDVPIIGPILVVIDALDESGDTNSNYGLSRFLAANLSSLPSNFRVLITSRPDSAIESAFLASESVVIKHMNDHELAATTHKDILVYLRTRLPSDDFEQHSEALARRAEGLFLWAAAACGYILERGPFLSKRRRMDYLLNSGAYRPVQGLLNGLYEQVLHTLFSDEEARDLFSSVVGPLLTAFEPLSIRSLMTLRQHTSDDDDDYSDSVVEMLRSLGSLLSNVTLLDDTLPIVPLHSSFRDFVANKEQSGAFYIDLRVSHRQLAHSCLTLLLDDLRFNICNLESSYLANNDVEELEGRILKHLSPALLYACRFWNDHLVYLDFEIDLFRKLETLFKKKFLFWLEVLSLTSAVGLASSTLSSLSRWLASGHRVSQTMLEEFRWFINDASMFVRYFGMAMAKSAPHIYLSALPFAPTQSFVSAHYFTSFPQILHMERGQLAHWPSSEMMISNVGGEVYSIALSPDGQRIVSGTSDGAIRVWNATTGETEAGSITGRTNSVLSVAFSPDGRCIVSGSSDGTLRVWNATTGEMEAQLTGHTDSAWSVAFSPDGLHIVSGSSDGTIRVWNATTGETVAGPITGHTNSVRSVAFSPDCQRIVSGSSDGTIRVWNATTGETEAGPLTGHTDSVLSVTFSPDGQHLVSGSSDGTIRVWNAATGELWAGPFTGHRDWVLSVEFSPDGQRIVSGSSDRTIRVWNTTTGEIEAGPFTGHTDSVWSVAFSPDGQRVVSGSSDQTIRVWNIATEETMAGLFTGHTDSIGSVAFSPNCQCVVSGSDDTTVRVWDTTTGGMCAGPFTEHSDWVLSVKFSPDSYRIASGSSDGTIRVWNAATGETEAGPFTGHTNLVESVAFSPDAKRIVSGSCDETIRVWNAATGEAEEGPLTGHSSSVLSVAFSPDGLCIVSGSSDGTIRVWNAATGETVAGPLTGHTDSVWSVTFSPDGQRIASGSSDCTIRMWNATTEETEASPFTGHTLSVWSVAFSPDGRRIVSGSSDRTIRVWNAATGEMEAGPFAGHTDWVLSVAFSPDGRWIVSGSRDRTIRLWDATGTAGYMDAGSFIGRMDSVKPVMFSLDGNKETTRHVDFNDHSVIDEDGWIRGSRDELVMWIPPIHRAHLHRPSNIWVTGEIETRMDLSTFAHGRSWAECIDA